MNWRDQLPSDAEGCLFVCSTSHMDWDWNARFEQYYNIGLPSGSNPHNPVRYTLDEAYDLILKGDFQYNLAEVAWLQRWLKDNPDKLSKLSGFGKNFCLMGGGITSPDNLVTNGEVFIRNYFVGRQYLKEIGLSNQISNVSWIPDDFGQDPELPATLSAMGLSAAAFWRVPGDEPGNKPGMADPPFAPKGKKPAPSIFDQLIQDGVTFQWQAGDGSEITALLLADGYGMPFYVSSTDPSRTASDLNDFITNPFGLYKPIKFQWPSENQFVPAGGDFSTPSTNLTEGIALYNKKNYPTTKIYAVLGTFEDYLETLPPLKARQLNPSNFWTGFFASRPQLKINQNKATRYLLAAETACSILEVYSTYSRAGLSGINRLIEAAWDTLVPSSHHDYVTGTSPDDTYWSEQLPQTESALEMANGAIDQCISKIAKAVAATPNAGEQSVLLYNDLGFDRNIGTLVELDTIGSGFKSVRVGQSYLPVQITAAGKVLLQLPSLKAMSYETVYLSNTIPEQNDNHASIVSNGNDVTLSNDLLTITISKTDKWGITSLTDQSAPDKNLVISSGIANEIVIYEDDGNLYQFGNEPECDKFTPESDPDLTAIGSGKILESGPLRVRFEGQLHSAKHDVTYTMQYTLILGEPLVRMSLQGSAPDIPSSIVTSFPLVDGNQNPPLGMSYGTANHWHDMDFVPYWDGPTFRATHNFAVLTNNSETLGAVYHQGTPAWAFEDSVLLGVLLRNAPGTQRGAAGTDTAEHMQEYALRLPGVGLPTTCEPLKEAYSVQNAPFAMVISQKEDSAVVTMPESNQLASIKSAEGGQSPALIRVVRTQAGSGSASTLEQPISSGTPLSLAMRIYQPTNDTSQSYQLELPFGSNQRPISEAEYITALEEKSNEQGSVAVASTSVKICEMPTLATIRIQTQRLSLDTSNGK